MAALQVFFTAPVVAAAAVPAVETSLSTADQAERPAEHVALVATDAGFMHSREQYARWVSWPGCDSIRLCSPRSKNCRTDINQAFIFNLAGVQPIMSLKFCYPRHSYRFYYSQN
jgi:hypothetical protein